MYRDYDEYERQLDFEDSLSRFSERQMLRDRIADLESELVTDPENIDIQTRITNLKNRINEI